MKQEERGQGTLKEWHSPRTWCKLIRPKKVPDGERDLEPQYTLANTSDYSPQTPWTIKKAERRRIDAFELLYLKKKHLRVPWTARRANQSILKEISAEYSLEGLMLKLKLQYFGHLMWRADSFEKTLILGKIEGRRRRGWQNEMVVRYHWLNGHEFK